MREAGAALGTLEPEAPLFVGVRGDQLRGLLKKWPTSSARPRTDCARESFRAMGGRSGRGVRLGRGVALAHAVGSARGGAPMRRGDRLELRRRLMDDWAMGCCRARRCWIQTSLMIG